MKEGSKERKVRKGIKKERDERKKRGRKGGRKEKVKQGIKEERDRKGKQEEKERER